jgi:hypothetical protein
MLPLPAIAPQALLRNRRRKRMHSLSRKQSRPTATGCTSPSTAHASTHGSRPKPPQSRQYNFFEMFFWGLPGQQSTYGAQMLSSSQTNQQPAYAQQFSNPRKAASSRIISGR